MFSGAIASNPCSGRAIMSAKSASVMRVRAAGAIAFTVDAVAPELGSGHDAASVAMPDFAAE